MRCVSRFLVNQPIVILKSFKHNQLSTTSTSTSKDYHDILNVSSIQLKENSYHSDEVTCESDIDFYDVSNPFNKCSLLKAVVIALGIVMLDGDSAALSLSKRLSNRFKGGLEIAIVSDLPAGSGTLFVINQATLTCVCSSGMGGSSILAAAAIQSLGQLINMKSLTKDIVIELVSYVEQLMTTGGGWQDQVTYSY